MNMMTKTMAMGLMVMAGLTQAATPPASLVMIPPQINYQGRLVTTSNTPYADALHTIDLTLYPTASGGTRLWSERYAVQTRDGYFSVNLGTGGTGLLASNPPIFQVLWKNTTDAQSPDTFFMALTVRTSPTGQPIFPAPEATPRQQFLTAPFAYRAHQSLYAAKADGVFDAPQGIQTPTLSSSTNKMTISSLTNLAISGRSMTISTLRDLAISGLSMTVSNQGHVAIRGDTMDLTTGDSTGFTFRGKPMFVTSERSATTTGSATTAVFHNINTTDYDVVVAGFSFPSPLAVRSITQNPTYSYATVNFATTPASGLTLWVRFLGIRKGLMASQ